MKLAKQQKGAVLFISLIFLLVMTLYAVSSINMSTVNLRIVGNMHAIKLMDADAQEAIEQTISTMGKFDTPTMSGVVGATRPVLVSAPECVDSKTATGYSAVATDIIPEDNTWEIQATVLDNVTGAKSVIHQGVEIRMLSGNCP